MGGKMPAGTVSPSSGILGLCLSPVPAPIPGLGLCRVQPSPPLPVTWSPLSLACPPRPAWALGGGSWNGEGVT